MIDLSKAMPGDVFMTRANGKVIFIGKNTSPYCSLPFIFSDVDGNTVLYDEYGSSAGYSTKLYGFNSHPEKDIMEQIHA